jgi:adenosylhomocysteinase
VKSVHGEQPLIIVEIGGYFANAIAQLRELLGPRLVGVIEDTEAGHRKYELQGDSASCPVLSVARSSLKLGEDLLVGTSCIFSCEKLLRSAGLVFEPRRPLVLGFGKVGTGLSHSLQRRGCAPTVFDTDPIRRVVALSSGFRVPKIEAALSQSDIIFGATANKSIRGSMFDGLEHGTILVSCSSKDDEFDLDYMMANYQVSQRFENVDAYSRGNKTLYLMANGRPINFIDGAVLGPALSLVQGEIIAGIKELFDNRGTLGLFELPHDARRKIAEIWFDHFFDPNSGTVRQA